MWDDRSFDTTSFSTSSWWLETVETLVRTVHKIGSELRRLVIAAEFRRVTLEDEVRSVLFPHESRMQEVDLELRQLQVFNVSKQIVIDPQAQPAEVHELRVLRVEVEGRTLEPSEKRVLSQEVETRKLPIYNQL